MDKQKIIDQLNEKISRNNVRERQGPGGRSLSYLEGHYVINRLNEVLGQGNWSYITEDCSCVHVGEEERYAGKVHTAHYIARVRLEVPILGCIFSDVGYGDGSDAKNAGKAHELAAKESVTDGLKRAAKNLGMSMGLALYSKEQENVEDEVDVKPVKAPEKPAEMVDKPKLISELGRVIVAKKIKSVAELQDLMEADFGTRDKLKLTSAQADAFISKLRGLLK